MATKKKTATKKNGVLGPLLAGLASAVGRPASNPALATSSPESWAKVPASISVHGDMKYVTAPKHGIELGFVAEVLHEGYPPIHKTKASLIPYLSIAWLGKKLAEPLPFGLELGMARDEAALRELLGPPDEQWEVRGEVHYGWRRTLDADRAILLRVYDGQFTIQVDEAKALQRHCPTDDPLAGLFIAWSLQRELLDAACFGAQRDLLAAIAAGREARR